MAEFLTRKGIVYHLDRIIEQAEKELVLISPYIKADNETKNILKNQKRSTKIHVIYGKTRLKPAEKSFFNDIGIEPSFLENLHAKCYLNEKEALLTSMNLYEYSQEHNDEMGILVSRKQDPELYEKIKEESIRLVEASENSRESAVAARTRKGTTPVLQAPKKVAGTPKSTLTKPEKGFCIRCKANLPANPTQPYCGRCYVIWNKFKNKDFEEKHCHTCGNEHATTFLKPSCPACFRKYKDVLEFAVS